MPQFNKKKIKLKIYAILCTIIGDLNAKKVKNLISKIIRKKEKDISVKKDIERLKKIGEIKDSLKLHFGCGTRILKNWINIDILYAKDWQRCYSENEYPKKCRGSRKDLFIIDLEKQAIPLPKNSVKIIFSEDFVEHLNQKEFVLFLAESHRILKHGGINHINSPDLIASMRKNSNFYNGRAGVYTNEWNKHGHINILTKKYLEELAEMIGYSKIIFVNKNQSKSKLIPIELRPGNDRKEEEQIFCDLIK
ncbi:methyltransferase domain-containing protein [Patescibacteria group bacterium]